MALKMNAEINIARMAGEKDVSLDWGAWGEKITTPGLVDKIQAAADAELAATLAEADLDKKSESIKAQIKAVFSGSNGLVCPRPPSRRSCRRPLRPHLVQAESVVCTQNACCADRIEYVLVL